MTGAQKISLSLLISVVVFSVLSVLAAVDRFQILEARFYIPRVEEGVRARAERTATVFDQFHRSTIGRFQEFTLEPSIRSAFRINASAAEIRDRQNRLDTVELEQASLDLVRIINVTGSELHYSSSPDDYTQTGTQRTYLRPDQASLGEPVGLESLAYSRLSDQQSEVRGTALPTPEIVLEPVNNQFIYRLPAVDSNGVLQGAALFYVNVSDVRTMLLRAGLNGIGDEVWIINSGGVASNVPFQFGAEILEAISKSWGAVAAVASDRGRVTLTTADTGGGPASDPSGLDRPELSFEAFATVTGPNGIIVFLEPSSSLEMPLILQYTLLIAVFLTSFLIVFLLLNVRQDAIVVISDRVKRFQITLLREYMESRREVDFQRWKGELEDRRDEVHREIRRGIGRVKPSDEEQVDALINESWDEIISVLSNRAEERPTVSLGVDRIEEIVSQLSERLASVNVARAAPPVAIPARPVAPQPVEVEEIDEDDVEELEDAGEGLEELEEIDEAQELEDAEELDEDEEPGEPGATPIVDVSEAEPEPVAVDETGQGWGTPVEVEELDEADEIDEFDEAQELDDAEELDEFDELDEADEAEQRGGPEGFDPEKVSLDNLDEQTELEWLGRLEDTSLPGPDFDAVARKSGRPNLEAEALSDEGEAPGVEEVSYWDTSERAVDYDSTEQADRSDQVAEIEELTGDGALEEAATLEDVEELEILEPEEIEGEAVAPEELSPASHGSTTFGSAFFSFARGTEVRLHGPAAIDSQEIGASFLDGEDAIAAQPVRAASEPGVPAAAHSTDGLIRFTEARDGTTTAYEIATLSEVLNRLHVDRRIVVESEGVVEIDRGVFGESGHERDDDVRKLVDSVIGPTASEEKSGIELLFGGGSDDLLPDLATRVRAERSVRSVAGVAAFRFVEQGFDYDAFLRGYHGTDSGVLKSLVRFTRIWNARIGIVMTDSENELMPAFQLGLDSRCADALKISKRSGLYRYVLARRNVLLIHEPIANVEYFHNLCSPENLSLFERSLFLPLVFRGTQAYALLGLPRSMGSLESVMRLIVPYLQQRQGVLS